MRVSKDALVAFLTAAKDVAAPRTASAWLRAARLAVGGLGDEVVATAWGDAATLQATLPGEGAPGAAVAADSARLLEVVGAAKGGHVTFGATPGGRVRVESEGRDGTLDPLEPLSSAPADPAPPAGESRAMTAGEAAGLARALRLGADLVDRDDVPDRDKHVVLEVGPAVRLVATDGASGVTFCAGRADAPFGDPFVLVVAAARALARLAEEGPLAIDERDKVVRVASGATTLNLRRAEGHRVLSLAAVEEATAKWGRAGERVVAADIRELAEAVRYAGIYRTSESSEVVITFGGDRACVIAPEGRGSTFVAARALRPGRSAFACDRLARALAGADTAERSQSALWLDPAGAAPLRFVVQGADWRRSSFVMPLAQEA